ITVLILPFAGRRRQASGLCRCPRSARSPRTRCSASFALARTRVRLSFLFLLVRSLCWRMMIHNDTADLSDEELHVSLTPLELFSPRLSVSFSRLTHAVLCAAKQ